MEHKINYALNNSILKNGTKIYVWKNQLFIKEIVMMVMLCFFPFHIVVFHTLSTYRRWCEVHLFPTSSSST